MVCQAIPKDEVGHEQGTFDVLDILNIFLLSFQDRSPSWAATNNSEPRLFILEMPG